MNIPIEVARAQGHHGIKGSAHGIKGGRPRLDLTDEERAARRREQKLANRPLKGRGGRPDKWAMDYVRIWGKNPGQSLTPEEFAEREPLWNAIVQADAKEAEKRAAEKLAKRDLRRATRKQPPQPLGIRAVGRNSPCPCSSGQKFKKCCGK